MVDAQGGTCGNALQAASLSGPQVIVELLLETGAEIDAQGGGIGKTIQRGGYGNAPQAASFRCREAIVKSCSRTARSGGGHEAIVKLLLGNGAEVDGQEGSMETRCRRRF